MDQNKASSVPFTINQNVFYSKYTNVFLTNSPSNKYSLYQKTFIKDSRTLIATPSIIPKGSNGKSSADYQTKNYYSPLHGYNNLSTIHKYKRVYTYLFSLLHNKTTNNRSLKLNKYLQKNIHKRIELYNLFALKKNSLSKHSSSKKSINNGFSLTHKYNKLGTINIINGRLTSHKQIKNFKKNNANTNHTQLTSLITLPHIINKSFRDKIVDMPEDSTYSVWKLNTHKKLVNDPLSPDVTIKLLNAQSFFIKKKFENEKVSLLRQKPTKSLLSKLESIYNTLSLNVNNIRLVKPTNLNTYLNKINKVGTVPLTSQLSPFTKFKTLNNLQNGKKP